MKPAPLLDELRAAFPPRPLRAARAFHMYSDGELCERAIEGKTWEQVDPRVIANRSDALAFLDDERFIAWLPMYLHLLSTVDPLYSAVPDTLIAKLTRPDRRCARQRFDALVARLTDAQRQVVTRCLLQVLARAPRSADGALVALKRYWGSFE